MQIPKKYEQLHGLPPYGPMYVAISENDELFYSEGFVVRFTKSDGTNWVANFKNGSSNFSTIFELPYVNKIVVIANGLGYIICPNQQKAITTFGSGITELLQADDGRFVAADNTNLVIINNDALVWVSKRISYDGIKELKVNGNIVSGYFYEPTSDDDEWIKFNFNIDTKIIEIEHDNYNDRPNKKNPFWKFW